MGLQNMQELQEPNNLIQDVPEQQINEFLHLLEVKNENKKRYYFNIIRDFFLFHGKGIEGMSQEECRLYLDYLERVQQYTQTSFNILKKKYKIIGEFIKFLIQNNQISFVLDDSKYNRQIISINEKQKKKRKSKNKKVTPLVIEEFLNYLKTNNYSLVNEYKKHISIFNQFLEDKGININIYLEMEKEDTLYKEIGLFERFLSKQITDEEILKCTATIYLRSVQLFVKFLKSKGIVSRNYVIPLNLRGRSKRSNAYVPKEEILELMNVIYHYSHFIERDLAVFLLIVDTGSRPIEISNITMSDIDLIENTISFHCNKTERRKVKISKEVMEVVKEYIVIRNNINPENDVLFLNQSGDPLTSSYINMIFYRANKNAYGESRYPARAFRHTFITNALEQNSFERVSRIIGHKDWRSTHYYLYRSNKRLLKNTLNHSPLKKHGGY
jgi:integrase/recombinase XerC